MKYLKYLSFLVILSWTMAWAGMIEMVDNDRVQYWDWNCIGDSSSALDSISLYISKHLDSGFVHIATFGDSTRIIFNPPEMPLIIYTDSTDTLEWIDPTEYNDEYWVTYIYQYFEGVAIPWDDTIHMALTIPTEPGCGGRFHVD